VERKREGSPIESSGQRVCAQQAPMRVFVELQRNINRAMVFVSAEAAYHVVSETLHGVVRKTPCGTSLALSHPHLGDATLETLWPLSPGRYSTSFGDDGFVLVIPTYAAVAQADASVLTSPWATLHHTAPIQTLTCVSCGKTVAHYQQPTLRALPSDHWEELVDAWMCHGDQRLNECVTIGRAGVETSRIPAPNELWIGGLLTKVASTQLDVNTSTQAMFGPWEVRTLAAENQATKFVSWTKRKQSWAATHGDRGLFETARPRRYAVADTTGPRAKRPSYTVASSFQCAVTWGGTLTAVSSISCDVPHMRCHTGRCIRFAETKFCLVAAVCGAAQKQCTTL